MSNSLDPDQDRHSVGPDLGPNCLQRLSADDTKKGYLCRAEYFYVLHNSVAFKVENSVDPDQMASSDAG